jgi:hypothetical protein
MVVALRKYFKLAILVASPLLLIPVTMVGAILGTLVSSLISGGGWENLGVAFLGALAGQAIAIILTSTALVSKLYKEKTNSQKALLIVLVITYFLGTFAVFIYQKQIFNFATGKQNDHKRLLYIEELKQRIELYYQQNKHLPEDLIEIDVSSIQIEKSIRPVTPQDFSYFKDLKSQYRLCANFDKPGKLKYVSSLGGIYKSQTYSSGFSCFSFSATERGYFQLR